MVIITIFQNLFGSSYYITGTSLLIYMKRIIFFLLLFLPPSLFLIIEMYFVTYYLNWNIIMMTLQFSKLKSFCLHIISFKKFSHYKKYIYIYINNRLLYPIKINILLQINVKSNFEHIQVKIRKMVLFFF